VAIFDISVFSQAIMRTKSPSRHRGALKQFVDLSLFAPGCRLCVPNCGAFAQNLAHSLLAPSIQQLLPLSPARFFEASKLGLLADDNRLDLSDKRDMGHHRRCRHSLLEAGVHDITVSFCVLL
jgi:hypothetical protein